MPAFEYTALDTAGRTARGVLDGDSDRHVRRQLRERGLLPVSVATVRRRAAGADGGGLLAPRLGGERLALLTRLLGTLLRSGLPVDEALLALSRQAGHADTRRITLAVRARVVEGHPLESGLAQFPGVFPDIYRATVGAGEQTRLLPLVLESLADYLERRQQFQSRIRVALIYPAVLALTAVLVVGGLLAWVVPEVVRVFEHVDRALPLLTRGLIALSDFVRAWGAVAAGALAVATLVAARAWRRPAVADAVDRTLLRLPALGALVRETEAARFARTLSVLLDSGVVLTDALHIASRAIGNRPMRAAVVAAGERVREGEPLARALAGSGLFPPLTQHLIGSGEASGQLVTMLRTAAESHERQVQTRLALFLGLVEPALILAMGAVVLAVVVAILLPIFEMNRFV